MVSLSSPSNRILPGGGGSSSGYDGNGDSNAGDCGGSGSGSAGRNTVSMEASNTEQRLTNVCTYVCTYGLVDGWVDVCMYVNISLKYASMCTMYSLR